MSLLPARPRVEARQGSADDAPPNGVVFRAESRGSHPATDPYLADGASGAEGGRLCGVGEARGGASQERLGQIYDLVQQTTRIQRTAVGFGLEAS